MYDVAIFCSYIVCMQMHYYAPLFSVEYELYTACNLGCDVLTFCLAVDMATSMASETCANGELGLGQFA